MDGLTLLEKVEKIPIENSNSTSHDINLDIEEGLSEYKFARMLASDINGKVIYVHDRKKFYIYDGIKYLQDKDKMIYRIAAEFVTKKVNEATTLSKTEEKNQINNFLRARAKLFLDKSLALLSTFDKIAQTTVKLDSNLDLINTNNCIINLKTSESLGHDPIYLMTKRVNSDFIPEAKAEKWQKFISMIFNNDEELIEFVQKAIGYSLSGSTDEQCFFFLHGNGRNGKSTFLSALSNLFSTYSIQSDYQAFTAVKNDNSASSDIARLAGSRFVVASESQQNVMLNQVILKSLTGGSDIITARHLYGEPFEYIPTFKIWFQGNHKPKIKDFDYGWQRRFKLIPFEYVFKDSEVRPQSEVLDEFKKESSGILNWALEGYKKWETSGLGMPEKIKNASMGYFYEQNEIAQFIDQNYTLNDEKKGQILAKDIYASYKDFCSTNGIVKPLGKVLLNQRLEELGLIKVSAKTPYFVGIQKK